MIPTYITREFVQNNKDTCFLFGDNLYKKGFGGQAKELRGEENAYGIPTKVSPGMEDCDFFYDDLKYTHLCSIELEFRILPIHLYKRIVILPLGVGLAELPKRAPDTYNGLLLVILKYSESWREEGKEVIIL